MAIKDLIKNKKALIKKKRSMPAKYSLPVGSVEASEGIKIATPKAIQKNDGALSGRKYVDVKVIANLSGWMDEDDDVILRGAYSKSINDKPADMFPFLKDHTYKMDSIIADTLEVMTQDMAMNDLGYDSNKQCQALVFRGRVWEDYDKGMYAKYMNGAVKQHSIGLRYVKGRIELAVNDPDYDEEYRVWQRYADQVVNIDKALEKGYFWAIQEIQLLENSAVVFGSNRMTPTIEVATPSEAANDSTSEQGEKAANDSTFDIVQFLKCI